MNTILQKMENNIIKCVTLNKILEIGVYKMENIKKRLEELRTELRNECISYGELAELCSLAEYIDKDDVELLQAAGVPEDLS